MRGLMNTMLQDLAGQPSGALGARNHGGGPRLAETAFAGPNPGALRMLSYAPAGLPPGSPLVVVLHGCMQDAAENAAGAGWLQLADRLGFAVLAPEQTASNNVNRCFNWFLESDTLRGSGECASIAQMVRVLTDLHHLDNTRVFITGLSAGGAMAAAMLAAYPDLFAGGAIVAGLPYGVAHNIQGAMRAMRNAKAQDGAALAALLVEAWAGHPKKPFRLSIWHGDKDVIVNPSNGYALAQQFSLARGSLPLIGKDAVSERLTRTRWGDAAPGGALIELNLVHGLGHGTPLSTRRSGDVGSPAPFLLECGVSSTLEVARTWGLESAMPSHAATQTDAPFQTPRIMAPREVAHDRPVHRPAPTGVAAQVMNSVERHVPRQVQDVIAHSLRIAGLMK